MVYDTILSETMTPPGLGAFHEKATAREAAWQRYVVPIHTSTLAAIVVLCGIFLVMSMHRIHHTDIWGHLNFGREIAETGALPSADPFRTEFADSTAALVNIPWLSQLAGYWIHEIAGPSGIQLLHALLTTATFGLLLLAITRRGVSVAWATASIVVAFAISLPIIGAVRPQLVGGLAFAATLLALSQLETRRHPLLWLPVLFALWANFHGSFAVGLVCLGALACSLSYEDVRRHRTLRAALRSATARRCWLAVVLCLIATCINPAGPAIWVSVLGFSSSANLADIVEWDPLVVKSLSGMLFFVTMLTTALLLRLSPRTIRLHEILLILAFAAVTLLAVRMIAWWALLWPFVIAPHIAALLRSWRNATSLEVGSPTPMRTLIAVAMVFMTLVWAPVSHEVIAASARGEAVIVSRETPLYLADEIERQQIRGRFFSPMDWAEYLTWHADGDLQPLVHAHVHLIPEGVWRDYQILTQAGAGWLSILEYHEIEYLALKRTNHFSLARLVARSDRFELVYQDQQALLYRMLPAADDAESELDTETATEAAVATVQSPEQCCEVVRPNVHKTKQVVAEVIPAQEQKDLPNS